VTLADAPKTDSSASADGASRFHLKPGERWYVAMTSPRRERIATRNLANQDICSFLPLQSVTRRHARRFRTELAPVFPRYIFVILDVDRHRWRSVNGTRGVERLISDGQRPVPVTPGVVETLIRSSDARGVLIYETDRLVVGDEVRLLAGPFAGSLGILQRLDGAGRVQLLLKLLGGPVNVTAPRNSVAVAR
jgi:transcription elongation factor/antiterminator RfaH